VKKLVSALPKNKSRTLSRVKRQKEHCTAELFVTDSMFRG